MLVDLVTYNQITFFQLTLEERIYLERNNKKQIIKILNPYNIKDACSFLEQLRAYQLSDILGKYKLF